MSTPRESAALSEEKILHQGVLTKCGRKAKTWKTRLFVLDNRGFLSYYRKNSSEQPLGRVDMCECTAVNGPGLSNWSTAPTPSRVSDDCRMELQFPGRSLKLYAENGQDANEWARLLRDFLSRLSKSQSGQATAQLTENAIRYGYITKRGQYHKSWKTRFFLLTTTGTLIYAKDQASLQTPLGQIVVRDIDKVRLGGPAPPNRASSPVPDDNSGDRSGSPSMTRKRRTTRRQQSLRDAGLDPEGGGSFEIITANRKLSCYCGRQSDAVMWVNALEQACMCSAIVNDATFRAPESSFSMAADEQQMSEIKRTLSHDTDAASHRRVKVIYNPKSGARQGLQIVKEMVLPIFRLANMDVDVMPTDRMNHARDWVRDELDPKVFDAVVVVGGDGMVCEVISGLQTRSDDLIERMPVGIIPAGTANAMANQLDGFSSHSQRELITRLATAIATGKKRKVDVLQVKSGGGDAYYCLSCVGYGFAGAIAARAEKLRWVPGQRRIRYDMAGLLSLLNDWPLVCACRLTWLPAEPTGRGSDGDSDSASREFSDEDDDWDDVASFDLDDEDEEFDAISYTSTGRDEETLSKISSLSTESASPGSSPPSRLELQSISESAITHARDADTGDFTDSTHAGSKSFSGVVRRPNLTQRRSRRPVTSLDATESSPKQGTLVTMDGEDEGVVPLEKRLQMHREWEKMLPPADVPEGWRSEVVGVVNMIASSLPRLGVANLISPDITDNDGVVCIAITDDSNSRSGTISAAMSLKRGSWLSKHKNVRAIFARQFVIEPVPDTPHCDTPVNIDGDAVAVAGRLDICVLHQLLTVFSP